jgi:hypothetical protein
MDKHSNLLRQSVNYGRKNFYSIGPSISCAVVERSTHYLMIKASNPAYSKIKGIELNATQHNDIFVMLSFLFADCHLC